MNTDLRVAFIGAGSMANSVHYPSVNSFKDVEITALCDLNPQRLQETGDRYRIQGRYSSYTKMVEEVAPDAVYAIGPPHQMYDVWTWLLRRGINLYIEKPMGITLHQAQSLARLAEEHGCITQVSFQRRSCPLIVQMREHCLRHGPIIHAICEFYKCAPGPDYSALSHMMDDGVHALDTLRWMCGGEVTRIHSVARRVGTHDLNFFTVLLEFDTGATGMMMTSWTSGRRVFRVQMHALGICIEAEHEQGARLYADGDTTGVEYNTQQAADSDQNYIYGGFRAKHRDFIDAIKEHHQPESYFGDALKTMELAERILAQTLV